MALSLVCALGVYAASLFFQRIPVGLEPPAVEIVSPPLAVLKEAEDCDFHGQIVFDTGASNFSAIDPDRGGEGLSIICEVPKSDRALSVWVRKNGGPVSLSDPGGLLVPGTIADQSENEHFGWTLLGSFRPADLPDMVVLRQPAAGAAPASIDCFLFTDHRIENKDSLLTSLEPLEIDPAWAISDFRDTSEAWGCNLPISAKPEDYPTPRVRRVRLAGWDEDGCREVITRQLVPEETGRIILNFPGWPGSMDTDGDGLLDEESKQGYAELVARLAGIVLEKPGAADLIYFELFDRPDRKYYHEPVEAKQVHRVAELARIYLTTVDEIRKNHPAAKIGGISAAISADTGFHDQFIAMTAPALDFYSIQADHPGGTEFLYTVKGYLKKNSAGRSIPLLISRGAPTGSPENSELVPNTWFLARAFSQGADTAIVSMDEDSGAQPREAAAFRLLNRILKERFSGLCAAFQTSDPENLAALTTQERDSLLLVYRGGRDREMVLPPGEWVGFLLENDRTKLRQIAIHRTIKLPGNSVIYLERRAED